MYQTIILTIGVLQDMSWESFNYDEHSIVQSPSDWKTNIGIICREQKCSALAAVVLAKTQDPRSNSKNGNKEKNKIGDTDIVHKLQRMMLTPNLATQDSSIEGLAYVSSEPYVKEELVKDKPFLKALILRLKNEDGPNPRTPRNNTTTTVGISSY